MLLSDLLNYNPQIVLLTRENGEPIEKPLKVFSRTSNQVGCITKITLEVRHDD